MKLSAFPLLTLGILLTLSSAQAQKGGAGKGDKIFAEQCEGCHGSDGKGQTDMGKQLKAADLTSPQVRSMSESQLTKTVTEGKDKMPAFGDKLSADEIKQ